MDSKKEKELQIAYYINNASINKSTMELLEDIEKEFGYKLKYSTVYNFRKNLPQAKIKELKKGRKEILNIIKFIITDLKDHLEILNDSDIKMKLKLVSEIKNCVKLYNTLLNEEIESIGRMEPF